VGPGLCKAFPGDVGPLFYGWQEPWFALIFSGNGPCFPPEGRFIPLDFPSPGRVRGKICGFGPPPLFTRGPSKTASFWDEERGTGLIPPHNKLGSGKKSGPGVEKVPWKGRPRTKRRERLAIYGKTAFAPKHNKNKNGRGGPKVKGGPSPPPDNQTNPRGPHVWILPSVRSD